MFYGLKVAHLRLVDWNTKEIYGFATCGLTVQKLRLCDLRTGAPKKLRIYVVIAE
jgi:hypothetical protein